MDFDVIIIGRGAGGGITAYILAQAGKRVLLLERGPRFTEKQAFQDEQRMLIEMAPFDDRFIRVNGVDTRLFIGGHIRRRYFSLWCCFHPT